ncbi:MAG: HtrA protease/chaperone protein [uncultured Solirubrobacteraceae bacterium]|uniref:HtrA protease/chaperone protein n=1 Tax=uncultured Solirubrobacteraceae bacterium TaxID=1162706 RepID=A0A6J4SMT8_9ACTN|nr:MAG: HtrA protease/chaperone protein [uncultured Solirubrobacteraceae bacterium]
METRTLIPVAVTSAVLGGGVVAIAVAVLGLGATSETTTIVQQAPMAMSRSTVRSEGGLTARDLYKRDSPGVVFVKADVVQGAEDSSPFDLGSPRAEPGDATGSGFVIDRSGNILTNAHVVDGAVKVMVQLADQKTVEARVVGRDTSSDLALLKIDPDGLALRPLELGSAKDTQVGDPVIAIGNPFGLDRTLTTGVVSALQRQITAPNGFTITDVIQTDAAINPGNSGGPLIDAAGRVIGINSQIEAGSGGGNVGIGFAVPIDTAKQILPALKQDGTVERAYLGITSLTIDGSVAAASLPTERGVLVQTVQQGSPAEKAGIRAGGLSGQLPDGTTIELGGDIIKRVAGSPIRTSDELARIVAAQKPGSVVTVELLRGKERRSVKVKLSSRPNASRGG